jgi:hypothetical protein
MTQDFPDYALHNRGMTVSLPRLHLGRRWPTSGDLAHLSNLANPANPVDTVEPAVPEAAERRRVNMAWALPVLTLVLCLVTTGWVFANGSAAKTWLVIDVAVATVGLPVMWIIARLFGDDGGD